MKSAARASVASMKRLGLQWALCAVCVGTFSGCPVERSTSAVAGPPHITEFTASARSGKLDEHVTLAWSVARATAVELREVSLGTLAIDPQGVSGTYEHVVAGDALFVLTVWGPGGSDARALSVALDGAHEPLVLHALPPAIRGGQSATLVWSAPAARLVSLSDGSGNLELRGQRTSGVVSVAPARTTTYTLTADGRALSATVTVRPAVLSFEADPRAVAAGGAVMLRWVTAGAERVTLKRLGHATLLTESEPDQVTSGRFEDTVPPGPENGVVTYVLLAEQGVDQVEARVTVEVATGLAVLRLVAPPAARPGKALTVLWETVGAKRIELRVDGLLVHRTSAARASSGSFAFDAPPEDFEVEVRAFGAGSATVRRAVLVDVVGAPVVAALNSSPETVQAGEAATLAFAVPEARRLRIVDGSGYTVFSVSGSQAEAGSVLVYPNEGTGYTLIADNQAGDPSVQASTVVKVAGARETFVATPRTALSGSFVELSYRTPGALLYGLPHAQVLRSTSVEFVDIRATGTRLSLSASGDDVALIEPDFQALLAGRQVAGPLTVSRAGWLAWGPSTAVSATASLAPSNSTLRNAVAPFWAELRMPPSAGVYVQVVGEAPERVLVVQWDRLEVAGAPGRTVTFQARVHQTGAVDAVYESMQLSPGFSSFSVGVVDAMGEFFAAPTERPKDHTAFHFFGPVVSPARIRVVRGGQWGGFVKRGTGYLRIAEAASAVVMPRDLAVSEVMFAPATAVPAGQYVEVHNGTDTVLDLSGWQLSSSNGSAFTLPRLFLVPASGVVQVGRSLSPVDNDGAGVTVAWDSAFSLPTEGGWVRLGPVLDAGQVVLSPLRPGGGTLDAGLGVALQVDPGPFLWGTGSAEQPQSCPATTAFGAQTPPQLGSPGVVSGCGFGYSLIPIPVSFRDISDGGVPLVNEPSIARDGLTVPIALTNTGGGPAPFVFGLRQRVVSMSLDGYLVLGTATSSTYLNAVYPAGPYAPGSTVAAFWDDLQTNPDAPLGSDMYWKRLVAGEDVENPRPHWVFQWAHVKHHGTSPEDDLNFEVKLFEDGVIELHYGAMQSGTADRYGEGASATVWLSNLDNRQALVVSVNRAWIRAHSAYRFVPR